MRGGGTRKRSLMSTRTLAILLCVAFSCALASPGRAEVFDRLQQQHFGDIAPGAYQAGDNVRFSLDRYQNEFAMRFAGQPEIYVLYADYGSLGGRVLKYDSGAIAIQVAGWGGMTLYTDDQPQGLPAVRTGDSLPPNPPSVALAQVQSAADDEAAHLIYARGVRVSFAADWNALTGDSNLRALAFDTMENAARGIDRFTANSNGRNVFSQRVVSVRFSIADKPYIKITDRVLIVTFNPRTSYAGRASSRAIATALGKMFGIPAN